MARDEGAPSGAPHLRLIRGNATPEEIAAVVALLAARSAPAEAPSRPVRSTWADPAQALRSPLHIGAGSWRRSGLSPGIRTRAGW
ncbi:acyl-CoA carboxylase subunit epsilon [Frankia sp. AgKG'84/4]|uniref:acyl-CoA carboxylase subunit epsilon n=1 Tax=Frankia sp. AgKG'84/4 TaxID=573490 RepID=UPI00200E5CAA|nr:acyl-CoA carboxylase subunit epsilon [Frankia sp. AgKG'84/4]MCL9793407.1 acyl-CoA carboxylase subunit epsilon [Frankia sp. AgKG'84/4]